MSFNGFYAKESPFHKEYDKPNGNSPNINVRVNKNMKDALRNHFEEIYDESPMTKGVNKILHEYMDSICLERKTFNHIEVIMLIPKIDIEDRTDKSIIDEFSNRSKLIAYYNTKTDFNDYYEHKGFDGEYNLVYELKEFNELNFPLNIIRETKDSCVINTSKDDCDSFEKFKSRQKELYSDLHDNEGIDRSLDLDDCYFVRFPINNYLDVKQNGQYNHKFLLKDHIGVYVFNDPLIKINNPSIDLKLLCFIDWHYLSDINRMEFDFDFYDGVGLVNWIQNRYDDEDSEDLINAIYYAIDDDFTKLRLKLIEDDLLEKLEIVRSLQGRFSDD